MKTNDLAVPELATVEIQGMSRGAFILRGAMAAGATYGLGAVSPFVGSALAQGGGDVEIVNFALTLEYLEAAFYTEAAKKVPGLSGDLADLVKELRDNETEHVDALIATVKQLGGTPAEKPMASFQSVIDGGANKILETAATVENLGAAAYLGPAGKIKNKDILAAALAIHSVEARHAAALNSLIGRGFEGKNALSGSIPDGAFAKPMAKADVLKAVQPFLTA